MKIMEWLDRWKKEFLLQPGTISLEKGQYIGVDLKNIKSNSKHCGESRGQCECDAELYEWSRIWTDVNTKSIGRCKICETLHVSDATANVAIEEFAVTYAFIGEKAVESDFAQNSSAE